MAVAPPLGDKCDGGPGSPWSLRSRAGQGAKLAPRDPFKPRGPLKHVTQPQGLGAAPLQLLPLRPAPLHPAQSGCPCRWRNTWFLEASRPARAGVGRQGRGAGGRNAPAACPGWRAERVTCGAWPAGAGGRSWTRGVGGGELGRRCGPTEGGGQH